MCCVCPDKIVSICHRLRSSHHSDRTVHNDCLIFVPNKRAHSVGSVSTISESNCHLNTKQWENSKISSEFYSRDKGHTAQWEQITKMKTKTNLKYLFWLPQSKHQLVPTRKSQISPFYEKWETRSATVEHKTTTKQMYVTTWVVVVVQRAWHQFRINIVLCGISSIFLLFLFTYLNDDPFVDRRHFDLRSLCIVCSLYSVFLSLILSSLESRDDEILVLCDKHTSSIIFFFSFVAVSMCRASHLHSHSHSKRHFSTSDHRISF